jgi:TolA-binding protein
MNQRFALLVKVTARVATLAAVCIAAYPSSSAADTGVNALVDRLSERIGPALAGTPSRDDERTPRPPEPGDRATVVSAALAACDAREACKIEADIQLSGPGPRLLLVDAGSVFKAGDAAWVAAPNQRFVVNAASERVTLVALPLRPGTTAPAGRTPLSVVASNDAGVLAVLRTVQRIETEDMQRLRRYVRERDGEVGVDTFIDNEDVRLARAMAWSKDAAGVQGRLPLEVVRFALYAVTANHTLSNAADWYRNFDKLEMNPAIALAGEKAHLIELVLERGGLNFRVYGPSWADHHYNRGVRAYREGDLEGAEKAFRTATTRQADLLRGHYNLGVTLYRKGKYTEADEAFQVGTGIDGAEAAMFYNRGATLWRTGDMLGAARMFREALSRNARDPEAGDWLAKADPQNKTAPRATPPKKGKKK